MEISKVGAASIKLKGKNSSLIIDPTGKTEAQIILATQPLDSLSLDKVEGARLIISGPGEYEVGGISITGKEVEGGIIYQILDTSKIIFTPSSAIKSVPDDEEFDCLLVKVVGEIKDDDLGPINAKCIALYGDLNLATVKSENQEKINKVNIRKTVEIQGKTFLLE